MKFQDFCITVLAVFFIILGLARIRTAIEKQTEAIDRQTAAIVQAIKAEK